MEIQVRECLSKVLNYEKKANYGNEKQHKLYNNDQNNGWHGKEKYMHLLDSYPPSAAYMRQWIWSALVRIIACRLFGAKPLSKPILGYCQLDSEEQTSVKF